MYFKFRLAFPYKWKSLKESRLDMFSAFHPVGTTVLLRG